MDNQANLWHAVAQQLRADSIRATTEAGSGHPTSSMSAADLMSVLLTSYLQYDFDNPKNPNNDHLIFSKGHASPLLYSMYKAAGVITDEDLLSLRKFGSPLQGHPVPLPSGLPWVEVATGSLGQGLPIGVGIGVCGKYFEKSPYRVWVLLGDSEMAEGSIWEAMAHASHYKLNNVIGVLDCNRLGQRGETLLGWNTAVYAERARAFGWQAIEIDGHDYTAINNAYIRAFQQANAPTLIVAKTVKGKGVSFVEDKEGWHGKALNREQEAAALQELGVSEPITVQVNRPSDYKVSPSPKPQAVPLPVYNVGSQMSTRQAYGDALKALGSENPDIVVLDAEVSNSTFAELFGQAFPEQFFEQYIAEEQMVATAVGFSVRDKIPFASTFAAFFTRAYDFIRMAAVSHANIRLCGSHAGVSIGEDGPSQMGLEDIAMMRTIYNSTVFYPSDANQTVQLVAEMTKLPGISYLRTTRGKTPVIYKPEETFPLGGSKVLRYSRGDLVTVIAAGITVHESLKAYEQLKQAGLTVRVIDAYSVKPIDTKTLQEAARDTSHFVVVEDHWIDGGLGDAVLGAFASFVGPLPHVIKLGVNQMPVSGTPEQLFDAVGISASHIVEAVRLLVGSKQRTQKA